MTKLHVILWRKLILALIITLISEKDAIEEFVLKSTSPKYTYRTEWYDQQVREKTFMFPRVLTKTR